MSHCIQKYISILGKRGCFSHLETFIPTALIFSQRSTFQIQNDFSQFFKRECDEHLLTQFFLRQASKSPFDHQVYFSSKRWLVTRQIPVALMCNQYHRSMLQLDLAFCSDVKIIRISISDSCSESKPEQPNCSEINFSSYIIIFLNKL